MVIIKPVTVNDRRSPFEETLVNKRAVAAFLGMTESGFVKMIHRGEGPPYLRIGRMIRFSPSAVKAWVATQIEITAPTIAS